jgi:hypothetical protein
LSRQPAFFTYISTIKGILPLVCGRVTGIYGSKITLALGTLDPPSTWTLTASSYITEFSPDNVIKNGYANNTPVK